MLIVIVYHTQLYSDIEVTIVGEHTPSLCPRVCVLVPDPEEGVPGAGADRHPVLGHPQARHAVIVARQHA